jgi:hypothetical protein
MLVSFQLLNAELLQPFVAIDYSSRVLTSSVNASQAQAPIDADFMGFIRGLNEAIHLYVWKHVIGF